LNPTRVNRVSGRGFINEFFWRAKLFLCGCIEQSGIESEKVKFTINYKGATEAKPKLFLLTIGIDKYKNPKYNLNYAQADADGVAKMITLKITILISRNNTLHDPK
jgi:hypothetical protein